MLRLAAGIMAADHGQIAAAAAPDITCTVPGHGKVSGTYRGPGREPHWPVARGVELSQRHLPRRPGDLVG